MNHSWETTTLQSKEEALHVFADLLGKRWLCRGQRKHHDGLVPKIDRDSLRSLSRLNKLALERQSIELFRSTARFFADSGEKGALADDVIALMVLRHYEVPTRLLDWSISPYVAAYFACRNHGTEDGEIWAFDEPLYERKGKEWQTKHPETMRDGKFDAKLTMFTLDEPPDWFICGFYPVGFPRQNAQQGAYSMTACFNRDHAEMIANLLNDKNAHHLYIVKKDLKPNLREALRNDFGIWRGSLYPDLAGAAEMASTVFPRPTPSP